MADRVVTDLGSALNCKKTGLKQLVKAVLNREITTVYLTHRDRLLRFGHELFYQLCRWAGTQVVILDESNQQSFEAELAQDVITLMAVYTARLFGRRSHINRKNRLAQTDPH